MRRSRNNNFFFNNIFCDSIFKIKFHSSVLFRKFNLNIFTISIYNSSFSKYGSVYKKQQQELANLNSNKAKVPTTTNPVFIPEGEYDFIAG